MSQKKIKDKGTQKETLKKVLTYIKRYRGHMMLSIVLATLIVVLICADFNWEGHRWHCIWSC